MLGGRFAVQLAGGPESAVQLVQALCKPSWQLAPLAAGPPGPWAPRRPGRVEGGGRGRVVAGCSRVSGLNGLSGMEGV